MMQGKKEYKEYEESRKEMYKTASYLPQDKRTKDYSPMGSFTTDNYVMIYLYEKDGKYFYSN
jgi:hypothetical protein